jgi:hypothetical protein
VQRVKIRRTSISVEEAVEVMRRELGNGYQIRPLGDGEIRINQGFLRQARVTFYEELDGTVFEAQGEGIRMPIPFGYLLLKRANDRGVAHIVASIIGQSHQLNGTGGSS